MKLKAVPVLRTCGCALFLIFPVKSSETKFKINSASCCIKILDSRYTSLDTDSSSDSFLAHCLDWQSLK